MTINQLVAMAERIHDAEGWNLGASSTRDTRNAFWMRVIGCAYWGHKDFNLHPDRQWHMKDPDGEGGRPHSDDVAVSMPARNFWDCIPGAGADGYRFEASFEGVLPLDQTVFIPMVPKGGGGEPAQPIPVPPTVQPYPSESPDGGWWGQVADVQIAATYARKGRPYPSDQKSLRWVGRIAYDIRDGMTKEDSLAKHIKELEVELGL